MGNCIEQYEIEARALLSQGVFDYIAGAAGDESGLTRNFADLQSIQLMGRSLRGISIKDIQLDTILFGEKYKTPVFIAPMGYQSTVHPDGEIEMAVAAKSAECPMVVSTLATQSLEDIALRSNADLWFQLYFMKDQGLNRAMVDRAIRLGCKAIVLTIDVPCRGARYRDRKSGFQISPEFLPKNCLPGNFLGSEFQIDHRSSIADSVKGALSWDDVAWLQAICKIPIVLKGILNPEDAYLAMQSGISGIVVSNHGARQFDALVTPVAALPRIRDAVGSEMKILADSGVRSGSDVIRLLCLGADAVMIGRPLLWGLAVQGAKGVQTILEEIKQELRIGMTILGSRSPIELGRHHIFNSTLINNNTA